MAIPSPISAAFGLLTRGIDAKAHAGPEAVEAELGLSAADRALSSDLLSVVNENPGITLTELQRTLDGREQAINLLRLVAAANYEGLVDVEPRDSGDPHLQVTELGKKRVAARTEGSSTGVVRAEGRRRRRD